MDGLQKDTEAKTSIDSKMKFFLANIFSFIKNLFASTQNVIGLDIGTSYIKIVQLQKARKGYLITHYITRAIPAAVKDNPESRKNLVQEFIKEFIADTRIKTKLARMVISGKGIYIFSFLVPSVSKKDLKGVVSIELKKRLPFQVDLSNISFGYFVTGQTQDEKGVKFLQVTCIAADSITINESVELLKGLNLRPTALSVNPDALANLLPLCLGIKPDQIVAVLDMGASSSFLNFYKGDMLQFTREIPIGGDHISKALTKSIATSKGTITLSIEDAERIKRECGIPLEEDTNTEYLTDSAMLLGSQISTLLRPTLEHLIIELVRTINYYTKTFGVSKIEGFYLTGGNSRLKNLDRFLFNNLGGVGRIGRLNPLQAVKGWADVSIFKQELVMEQAAPHLSAAFGVCLGRGGRVNLLPVKERIEQRVNFLMVLTKAFLPVILGLGILFYISTYVHTFRYKALIRTAQQNIESLQPIVDRIKDYLSLKSKIEQRKSLLEKAVGRQPVWWGILKELSAITPKEVVLNKITTTQNQPLEIRLEGEIFAKYTTIDLAISQYLLALNESPFFKRVQLVSTKRDMYSAIPRANFEIICQLNY